MLSSSVSNVADPEHMWWLAWCLGACCIPVRRDSETQFDDNLSVLSALKMDSVDLVGHGDLII
jgi:hypothetical protein